MKRNPRRPKRLGRGRVDAMFVEPFWGPTAESLGVTSGAYRGTRTVLGFPPPGAARAARSRSGRLRALQASSYATRAVRPNYSRSPRAVPTSPFWLPDAPDERAPTREERLEQAGRLRPADDAVREGVPQLVERAVAEQQLQEGQLREVGVVVAPPPVRLALGRDQPASLEPQLQSAPVEAEPQRPAVAGRRRLGQRRLDRRRDLAQERRQVGHAQVPGVRQVDPRPPLGQEAVGRVVVAERE